ncbi:MAG: hypothetical protein ACI8W8_002949 [Rhodothermales bacterium]
MTDLIATTGSRRWWRLFFAIFAIVAVADDLLVTGRMGEILDRTHCGFVQVVQPIVYDDLHIISGTYSHDKVTVLHGCVEIDRQNYGGLADGIDQLRTGDYHQLRLAGPKAHGQYRPSAVQLPKPSKIILVAGSIKEKDWLGHHDYLAGCKLLADLLQQTANVETIVVEKDWPADASVFDGAAAILFFSDGAGKQPFLQTPERIAILQKLMSARVGLVALHQVIDFSKAQVNLGRNWLGATFATGSGRGHWPTKHSKFPRHAITRAVAPWEIKDGWLCVHANPEITPVLWAAKSGNGAQNDDEIVAWAFERADGGRSFSFSGADAHSAFQFSGVRKMIVNGILWAANRSVPMKTGAPVEIESDAINAFLSPRTLPIKR